MCKKCKPHQKYWVHISDDWSYDEKIEMLKYLAEQTLHEVESMIQI